MVEMGKNRQSSHEGYDMQKQHRISNRAVGHLGVKAKLVVQVNPLVQRPQTITNCQESPEQPAAQRVSDCVANRETRSQNQKQEITDAAVRKQERTRLHAERKRGFDDYDSEKRRRPWRKPPAYLRIDGIAPRDESPLRLFLRRC